MATRNDYRYYVDANVTNQGMATALATRSMKDILTLVGTTNKATVTLSEMDSGSATTKYTFPSSLDMSAYENITWEIRNGAIASLDAAMVLRFPSPNHIVCQPNQRLFGGSGSIRFKKSGTVYPDWFGGSNTVVQTAIDSIPVGGRVGLLRKYKTSAITLSVPTDYTGDAAKSLVGMVTMSPRYAGTTDTGAMLYLSGDAASSDRVLSIVGGGGAMRRAQVVLDNFRIHGNKDRGLALHQKSSHGLFISNIKDVLIGKMTVEECGGDGINAGASASNQLFGEYIESHNNRGRGFAFGSLSDSHFDKLLTYNNWGIGLTLGATVQIGEIHAFYNGMNDARSSGDGKAGISIASYGNQIDLARITHNDANGINLSYGPNYIGHAWLKNNGQDLQGVLDVSNKNGIRFSGTTHGNIVSTLTAYDSAATPSQQYACYFLTGTTESNVVGHYYGRSNVYGDVYFASSSDQVNNRFPQRPRQYIKFKSPIRAINASSGDLTCVGTVDASVTVTKPKTTRGCDGMTLTYVFKSKNSTARTLTFATGFVAASSNKLVLRASEEKATITFKRSHRIWYETARQKGM